MSYKNKPRVIKWNEVLEKVTLMNLKNMLSEKGFIKEYSMNPLIWSFRAGKTDIWWTNQNSDGVLTGHEKTFEGESNVLYL